MPLTDSTNIDTDILLVSDLRQWFSWFSHKRKCRFRLRRTAALHLPASTKSVWSSFTTPSVVVSALLSLCVEMFDQPLVSHLITFSRSLQVGEGTWTEKRSILHRDFARLRPPTAPTSTSRTFFRRTLSSHIPPNIRVLKPPIPNLVSTFDLQLHCVHRHCVMFCSEMFLCVYAQSNS